MYGISMCLSLNHFAAISLAPAESVQGSFETVGAGQQCILFIGLNTPNCSQRR